MGNVNITLIIGIELILGGLLFVTRLIAMKLHRDPISKRYKSGTPEYEAYQRFMQMPRFAVTLGIAALVTILLLVYVIFIVHQSLHSDPPVSYGAIGIDCMVALLVFAGALITGYLFFIKED